MAFLEQLLKNSQQQYPGSEDIGQRLGLQNMALFAGQYSQQPQVMGPQLPVMPEQGMAQETQTPLQAMAPQSNVKDPYNLLERVFLSVGGQGAAVKEDKQRYAMGKLIEQLPPPAGNTQLQVLHQAAIQDPDQFGASYLKMVSPDRKVQDVDGQLVSYDANNPTAGASVLPVSGAAGGVGRKQTQAEMDLRKEVDALSPVKDYRAVNDAYSRIQASAKNPSPAGDLALIFNYMKILDPGSTVREGEFATAQNSGSIPERVRAQYNKAISGERLAPEMRNDFVSRARELRNSQASNYNQVAKQYRGLASQYGYDQDRIISPVELAAAPPLPANATREQKLQRLQQLKAMKGRQ